MPLDEIRRLFESAETESDPERKFSCLEEALDLSDDFIADNPGAPDLTVVSNVRHSHLRRLVAQLAGMRNIDIAVWFNYIRLFLLRVEPEVDAVLAKDPELASLYRSFMDLWRDELLAAAERSR
jgi:hypothetical protein